MSDIVERLRGPSPLHWECKEAADEIERLRAVLRFYAEANNYKPRAEAFGEGMYAPHVIVDAGYIARAALEGKSDE